ncbi:MAG: GGDEF domain-containing protein [Gammaproteobacteria bacterium]|nr:GGDEF domain-containing protein [Gammaproteobacteria bacterium]
MKNSTDFIKNKNDIYDKCVQIVYKRREINLYSHIVVSPLLLYLGWDTGAWDINLFLVSLLWVYVLFGFFITPLSDISLLKNIKTKTWGKSLYYQLTLLGILYNLIFINLAYHGAENAMVYLLLISALYSAGAVGNYQHIKGLSITFTTTLMSIQCIYYLSTNTIDGIIMAFLILIFIGFIIKVGLELHNDAMHILSLNCDLITANDNLKILARTDTLTGINNRRSFFEYGNIILSNSKRYNHSLSIVMLDIDNFKLINDTFGHAIGDVVLKSVADTISKEARNSDISGRIGGEEFAIILQETSIETAQNLIERLRKAIQDTKIQVENQYISVTASFGISQIESESDDFNMLLSRADKALYTAKDGGKNQVIVY